MPEATLAAAGANAAPRAGTLRFEQRSGYLEFLPEAVINAVLVVVTFNVYIFWAKTNVRRYLWRTTRLGGSPLAYTGRAPELAKGFVLAAATFALVLGLPLLVVAGEVGARMQGLDGDLVRATGNPLLDVLLLLVIPVSMSALALLLAFAPRIAAPPLVAALCAAVLVAGWFYALTVSRHLTIRYLLRHTSWRHARGDLASSPWRYARELWWAELSRWLTLGWTGPWRYMRRWRRLLPAASFGGEPLSFEGRSAALYPRFAAAWVAVSGIVAGLAILDGGTAYVALGAGLGAIAIVLVVAYYNECAFRHLAASTRLGRARFRFRATWRGLARLYLVNLIMNVCSVGLAYYYTRMRIAKFMAANLELDGLPVADGTGSGRRRGEPLGEGLEALVAASYL